MTQRRTIGHILMGLGRITEADVAQALAYQRDNGGYFGEALLGCGLVSEGELEWGLASQFDLPYVFPDADEIDYQAASLVSPEWALAHLTLPIMRTGDTLTVIMESPINTKAVDELRTRTDLNIEMALASPSKIRELIRQVYARATAAEDGSKRAPVDLAEAFASVLEAGSARFGVSVRGAQAWAWWDDHGSIRRRPLTGDWLGELEQALDPAPTRMTKGQDRALWSGELNRGGMLTPVDVHYLADESGREYLFRPRPVDSPLRDRFPAPAAGIQTEISLLARSGKARFVVTTDPPALGHEILPHLPELLLDPSWRSIYINAEAQPAAAEAFSQRLPADRETWATELETLRAFHFDVVTVDLSGGHGGWAASALDVASVAFLLWDEVSDARPAFEAGIRWHLKIERRKDSGLEWTLEPLHG
jgi:MshEN domain